MSTKEKLKSEKTTTSMFLRGMSTQLKKDLEKLKTEGGFRTYPDLLEALVKRVK